MHTRPFLFLLPTLLLGSMANAQSQWDWTEQALWGVVATDGLPQNQVARNMVAGNLTGHDAADLAFLLGTDIAVFVAPSIHNATRKIMPGVAANGLAVIPRSGSYGRDALAVATDANLLAWSVDQGTRTVCSGNWQSVCVGNLDGIAPDDFVGLSSGSVGGASDRLRICLRKQGLPNTVSEILFPNQVAANLTLAQWNGSGPQEICVATNAGLWIGDPTSTNPVQYSVPNDGNSILRRAYVNDHDELVWYVAENGAKRLRTYGPNGSYDADATALGAVTDLCAADWDFFLTDNVADLLVSRSNGDPLHMTGVTTHGVVTYLSHGQPNQGMEITPFFGTSTSNHLFSAAWMGDLNGDRSTDLAVVSRTISQSGIATTSAWSCRRFSLPTMRVAIDDEIEILIDGGVPAKYTITRDLTYGKPVDATHIEMIVYEAEGETGKLRTRPAPFRRERQPHSATSISFRPSPGSTAQAFGAALRWIQVDASGTVRAWPSTLVVFALDGAIEPYDFWFETRIEESPAQPAAVWQPFSTNDSDPNLIRRPLGLRVVGGGTGPQALTGDQGGGSGDLPPPPPGSTLPKPPPPGG